MAFTGKFVYMAHHVILLRLNPFRLRVDGHSVSWLSTLSTLSTLCHGCGYININTPL